MSRKKHTHHKAGWKPACARTGFCCMLIPISWSPRALREGFENWRSGKDGSRYPWDVELLYPMLSGRCKGKRRIRLSNGKVAWRYIYGPCRNLDWAVERGRLTPSCAIHDNKPKMCSGFPFYKRANDVTMGERPDGNNPGTFKGCGFNESTEAGWDIETYDSDLVPLTAEEK